MRAPFLCYFCKHLQREKTFFVTQKRFEDNFEEDEVPVYVCSAYPNGIPEAVFETSHFYAKPGDNGLRFELKNEEDEKRISFYREGCTKESEQNAYEERLNYLEDSKIPDKQWDEYIKKKYGANWKEHEDRIIICD